MSVTVLCVLYLGVYLQEGSPISLVRPPLTALLLVKGSFADAASSSVIFVLFDSV